MKLVRLILVITSLVLAACGGSKEITCDEGPYQVAIRADRIQAPEGLDNLDPLQEMPLPSASPQEPRPADGPCLEQPPQILRME